MLPPEQAAAAFYAEHMPDGIGNLAEGGAIRAALAALVRAERAAVREAYRDLLFRAEEDAPTHDAAVALGRFAEAMLALPLE
jgi:hypothetical protein